MADYKLIVGNTLRVLANGKPNSIHTVITSPPYFGLRNYGGGTEEIGSEKTPEEYISNLVDVFREVRKMLRPDGTLWLNLGDSYNGSGGAGGDYGRGGLREGQPKYPGRNIAGLGPKQLLGIPWRVAFALQADGWILRSDIIWSKPNPMPESVTDRPTKAHEYIFLFSKSSKYFYDNEAIKEPVVTLDTSIRDRDAGKMNNTPGRTRMGGLKTNNYATKNKRSVWTVTTKPYKGAHFATFPPDLIEPMVLAGTSEYGCCKNCGNPYKRIIEKETAFGGGSGRAGRSAEDANAAGKWAGQQYGENIKLGPVIHTRTLGWEPTCDCEAEVVPCWVLDPFAGACTTGVVALKNKRKFIGIDLKANYIAMGEERIQKEVYDR